MAEQTFRSPGFFEQEIDLSTRTAAQLGTPAGIIGTSDFGPAFVPVTVGNFRDFETRFGSLNPRQFGPYAVREFLKYRNAVTFTRVLGAGANSTTGDIANTSLGGIVKNAGFKVQSTGAAATGTGQKPGGVVFIAAKHTIPANSDIGFPVFTDNDSFPTVREKDTHATVAIVFANAPTAAKTITLVATDGTSVEFTVTASTTDATNFARTGADHGATNFKTAIEASSLSGKIIVDSISETSSGVHTITLRQATVGSGGNTTVTSNLDNVRVGATNTTAANGAFVGGDSKATIAADTAFLIRAGIMTTTGSNVFIFNTNEFAVAKNSVSDDLAKHDGNNRFKIGIFSMNTSGLV